MDEETEGLSRKGACEEDIRLIVDKLIARESTPIHGICIVPFVDDNPQCLSEIPSNYACWPDGVVSCRTPFVSDVLHHLPSGLDDLPLHPTALPSGHPKPERRTHILISFGTRQINEHNVGRGLAEFQRELSSNPPIRCRNGPLPSHGSLQNLFSSSGIPLLSPVQLSRREITASFP